MRAEPREAWQSTIEMNEFYVYIMTCKNNTVLYTGVTRDLKIRAYEHISQASDGFTKRYNLTKLVYYEVLNDPGEAIVREKQIKAGTRARKIALVSGLKFLAPRCQEFRNLTNGFLCYYARLPRSKLRGPGAHPARVRNHVWFIPYREAPRSGIRLQCACNRFQSRLD